MSETMNISVNGQSQVPPGFRFHPTEEELLQYYLRKRVCNIKIDLDVIRDVDLNKLEPWEIQEKCKIGSTPQSDWYFFSHKDKKYPTGTRTNRATVAGFWKATGRDKGIFSGCRRVGMRKTLVFYQGRAPHGQKSDWIMHEYRLDDSTNNSNDETHVASNVLGEASQDEGWVVCRIFMKKSLHKTLNTQKRPSQITTCDVTSTSSQMFDEDSLEHALEMMGRSCKEEKNQDPFLQLPSLESPNSISNYLPVTLQEDNRISSCHVTSTHETVTSWAALDRLVASQLDGHLQFPAVRSSPSPILHNQWCDAEDYSSDAHLWSGNGYTFARAMSAFSSSPDPFCHVSHDGE